MDEQRGIQTARRKQPIHHHVYYNKIQFSSPPVMSVGMVARKNPGPGMGVLFAFQNRVGYFRLSSSSPIAAT